jgi:hypothetical protein
MNQAIDTNRGRVKGITYMSFSTVQSVKANFQECVPWELARGGVGRMLRLLETILLERT